MTDEDLTLNPLFEVIVDAVADAVSNGFEKAIRDLGFFVGIENFDSDLREIIVELAGEAYDTVVEEAKNND